MHNTQVNENITIWTLKRGEAMPPQRRTAAAQYTILCGEADYRLGELEFCEDLGGPLYVDKDCQAEGRYLFRAVDKWHRLEHIQVDGYVTFAARTDCAILVEEMEEFEQDASVLAWDQSPELRAMVWGYQA